MLMWIAHSCTTSSVLSALYTLVEEQDIASFMSIEVKKILSYMNSYRLQNIMDHSDFFIEYLHFINKKSLLMIQDMLAEKWCDRAMLEKMPEFVAHTTAMKWYLLLTLEEFCHASPTRIAINKLMYMRDMKTIS